GDADRYRLRGRSEARTVEIRQVVVLGIRWIDAKPEVTEGDGRIPVPEPSEILAPRERLYFDDLLAPQRRAERSGHALHRSRIVLERRSALGDGPQYRIQVGREAGGCC